jgi:hypothetical protein
LAKPQLNQYALFLQAMKYLALALTGAFFNLKRKGTILSDLSGLARHGFTTFCEKHELKKPQSDDSLPFILTSN